MVDGAVGACGSSLLITAFFLQNKKQRESEEVERGVVKERREKV